MTSLPVKCQLPLVTKTQDEMTRCINQVTLFKYLEWGSKYWTPFASLNELSLLISYLLENMLLREVQL